MRYREFGSTGRRVSEIGFGAWAIGGSWGDVSEDDARAALHAALDAGVNFIDTADVYGDGRSERIIAAVLAERVGERPFVATKVGRRISPHMAHGYTKENLISFVERSLENLRVDCLDLVQLHCPPTEIFYRPDIFDIMEELVASKKIRNYGVSVEKIEEGLKAIEYPGLASVQIIYNIFRQRPAQLFFGEAQRKKVAVVVRVPLASGLLTGKMTKDTSFGAEDHRRFNRNGEQFDKGETFAGVPFELALELVEEIKALLPEGVALANFALRWVLMQAAVSTVIPGAKNARQAQDNAEASALTPLAPDTMQMLRRLYEEKLAQHVHHCW